MELTFWGVRGSVPAPGPGTVRYGGNTACLTLRGRGGEILILDCGTGARNLGLSLMPGPFGKGAGEAAILLSHTQWGHIQGFPFFGPLYVPGNKFAVYGGGGSSGKLEGILEGQMAPQYFPVQTLKNMGAEIQVRAVVEGTPFSWHGLRLAAALNPHGKQGALAFRIEEAGRSLVYVGTAGYAPSGPPPGAQALYRGADVLVHDSTYTPEDRVRYASRGFSSVDDAVQAAVAADVKKLVLFSFDQDYTDADVDALVARARGALDAAGKKDMQVSAAAEGLTLTV